MKFRAAAKIQEVTRHSTSKYEFFSLQFERPTGEVNEDGAPITEIVTPWIECRPVGEVNEPYINAVLARQSKNRRRVTQGKITASMLKENRAEDFDLYPEHVFTGRWGGWIDDESGEEVPYSKEAAKALLRQLPFEEVDELRAHCNELQNFRS